jgi:hypothetical protein
MKHYEHLQLYPYQGEVQRQTRRSGSGYKLPPGRNKSQFSHVTSQKANEVTGSFNSVKTKFPGIKSSSLIFAIEINQSVNFKTIEQSFSSMGIHILSSAENKKGFWIVFSDDENLNRFKSKLSTYGSEKGPKYDFFHAIESLQDIPREEKIGARLTQNPLSNTQEFIDLELWKMTDPNKNLTFINELKDAYPDYNQFRIADQLITKSFVLLRVKLIKSVFDEIIELKEISRADRPSIPIFNPFELKDIDISQIIRNAPDDNAAGILIVDSGIVSNHPLLEKCVGAEENFQTGEPQTQDNVGHGTSVAGCAAYGDIEKSISEKVFTPSNWIFSAKVMFAETNPVTGVRSATYDPEKLLEHQLQDAIESFLSNSEYHIRVINISLGNADEIWHRNYRRQLPLASLIDELAYTYPNILFIVSTGNQHPIDIYDKIEDITANYPTYLLHNDKFKLINPATSALALTVGSIATSARIHDTVFSEEQIKTSIARSSEPSPFTRIGPGINNMVKPELIEYGGNLILYNNYGQISEDIGGKIALLNNNTTEDLIRFDIGSSYAAPKVAHIAGQIANKFPQRSATFISNMLISSADYPVKLKKDFYGTDNLDKDHLNVSGYGLPSLEKAINSYDNRTVLFDEGKLQLNYVKVYSLQLPEIFFNESGKKRITVTLTFLPETRSSRGDSYLGNRMEFHLFHSVNPQELTNKYGVVTADLEEVEVPEELKGFKIELFPGSRMRNAGCHQKAWKDFKREPKARPASPVSLVLVNYNKWMPDDSLETDYCISVTFEHEKEIDLYNQLRTSIQTRARVR